MRRLVLPLLAAAALCMPAVAQDATPKIAVLVRERLIEKSAHARKLFSEVELKGKDLQSKLEAKAGEGQTLQQQLQASGLTDEGREKLQRQLRDLQIDYKKMQEDSQNDFEKVKTKVFEQFSKEIAPIIEAMAKEKGLQVVVQYQPGLFAYVDETWALAFSDEVAARYDAKFPDGIPAPAAPAAKPAAKPANKK